MIQYDIYLLQLGFHPLAVVGKLVQKYETAIYKRGNNTKAQNTQNRKQMYKTGKQT
jgi:23S rRNA maturation mini-RNase III